jgi:hypothetical protein
VELRYSPSREVAELGVGLGYVEGLTGLRGLAMQKLQAWRGRAGKKPPEELWVSQHAPDGAAKWPGAKWRGLFAAAERALAVLCSVRGELSQARGWLAYEFALRGYASREGYGAALGAGAEPWSGLPESAAAEAGGLLVWREFIARETARLQDYVAAQRNRNPFLDWVTRDLVMRWLRLPEGAVAGLILQQFATAQRGQARRTVFGPTLSLSPRTTEARLDAAVVVGREMLKCVAQDELTTAAQLKEAYPSHQHVVAWLVDAAQVLDCRGYLFCRGELMRVLKALSAKHRDITQAGVRELKDSFGYSRRKAESLRGFLLERLSQHGPLGKSGGVR